MTVALLRFGGARASPGWPARVMTPNLSTCIIYYPQVGRQSRRPGQAYLLLPARSDSKWKRKPVLEGLSGEARVFPIIGDPIRYVQIIPRLTSEFATRGHNGICVPMQVPDGALDVVLDALTRTLNVDGLLVTMPHKFTAFEHCATSSQTARVLGGVSVMRRNDDG